MKPKNGWTAGLLWCVLVCGGCAAGAAANSDVAGGAPAHARPDCLSVPVADDGADYRIRAGDKLNISFYLNSEFNSDTMVRPDGRIQMSSVGDVAAAGLTPAQLEAELNRRYSKELLSPGATVRVDDTPGRVVYVEGQVGHPGTVPLAPGMTALQAITAAGGLTDDSGPNKIVLVRRDACGDPHDEQLDLARAIKQKGHQDDVVLARTDVLIVPRSAVSAAGLFVKQYIKDLMPVNPYVTAPLF